MKKPAAPLSFDLDNKWSYLMTHGDPGWATYPSYLETLVPRVLDFLDARSLRVTFFIVGRDAAMSSNRDLMGELVRRGHRIGNHSFDHQPWLQTLTPAELTKDFDLSETAIENATGIRPRGFRGPGYSLSQGVLTELVRRGYDYDATVFPNILHPLSRAYYFRHSNLDGVARQHRKELFGTWRSALRPNKAHMWQFTKDPESKIAEVPVSTFPVLRTPIHLSYLTYLGAKSLRLADAYYRGALLTMKLSGNAPSMLLHPLDFLGSDDEPALGFFPGMNLDSAQKLELADHFLTLLQAAYQLGPIEDYMTGLKLGSRRWDLQSASSGG